MGAATLLPAVSFEHLFRSGTPQRDKFLSRLFGLFGEEIVRIWCQNPHAPYEDLGRPTLRLPGERRGKTLDFTFRSRLNGGVLIGEMKCELEFENYRYLSLTNHSQLQHHTNEAFHRFLNMAKDPRACAVTVAGRATEPSGAILVWGSVTREGRRDVLEAVGLADVLSVEDMVTDLLAWRPEAYQEFLRMRARWCENLFSVLAGGGVAIRGD